MHTVTCSCPLCFTSQPHSQSCLMLVPTFHAAWFRVLCSPYCYWLPQRLKVFESILERHKKAFWETMCPRVGVSHTVYFSPQGAFLGPLQLERHKINQFLTKNNKNLALQSTGWLNSFLLPFLSQRHVPSLKVSMNTNVKAFSAQTWPRCIITNLCLQNAAQAHTRTNLVILS